MTATDFALSRRALATLAALGVLLAGLIAWQLDRPGSVKPAAAAATQIYVKVTGAKQGVLKGDATTVARKDWIVVLQYDYELTSPRDPATGLATGKRQHKPVRITHMLDAASPQLLQAESTNEVLKTVVIEFVRPSIKGESSVYYRVTLTNASISDVTQTANDTAQTEQVSFTFQKIEQESIEGKTSWTDDWSTAIS